MTHPGFSSCVYKSTQQMEHCTKENWQFLASLISLSVSLILSFCLSLSHTHTHTHTPPHAHTNNKTNKTEDHKLEPFSNGSPKKLSTLITNQTLDPTGDHSMFFYFN